MGTPVVSPSKIPERISTLSFSARGVVTALCPGLAPVQLLLDVLSGNGKPGGRAVHHDPDGRTRGFPRMS